MRNVDLCPYCGSRDIFGDHVDCEGQAAFQPCACNECDREWTVEYTATMIHTDTNDALGVADNED